MRQFLKKGVVQITFDKAFGAVISACGSRPRPGQDGTWITAAMCAAYVRLHKLGFAHSIEAWEGGMLVGGLYGVSLGRVFFGESMFSKTPNCSKAALITLVFFLRERGFDIIDCQVESKHLESLGARLVPRKEFSLLLQDSLRHETLKNNWGENEV